MWKAAVNYNVVSSWFRWTNFCIRQISQWLCTWFISFCLLVSTYINHFPWCTSSTNVNHHTTLNIVLCFIITCHFVIERIADKVRLTRHSGVVVDQMRYTVHTYSTAYTLRLLSCWRRLPFQYTFSILKCSLRCKFIFVSL